MSLKVVQISMDSTSPLVRLSILLILPILALPTFAHGQDSDVPEDSPTSLPDSPKGAHAAKFLQAFNTGDEETIRAFVGSSYDPEALKKMGGKSSITSYFSGLYLEMGPVGFHNAELVSIGERSREIYWLYGKLTRAWIGLTLRIEENEPHRLTGHSVIRGMRPSSKPSIEFPKENLGAYLNTYLSDAAAADHFSGVVLVARNGDIQFEGAYGFADKESKIPVRLGTRFPLASVTKMFTGVAIAQLAERGALKFDDAMSNYIPEYPIHIAEHVTLHQLLTHQSGIELDDHRKFNRAITEARSMEELLETQLKFIQHLNRGNYDNFEVLGSYDYTNEGIDLLGVIVERVSNQPWQDYIEENIFEAAGMNDSGTNFLSPVSELATGYSSFSRISSPLARRRVVDHGKERAAIRPAGSGWSTAHDLLKFAEAMRTNQLLSPEIAQRVLTPHVEVRPPIGLDDRMEYGYTFDIQTRNGLRKVGHRGSSPGMSTAVRYYPEEGWVIVVLSNYDRVGDLVLHHIEELISVAPRS